MAVGVGHLPCLPHVVLQVLQSKILGAICKNHSCKSKLQIKKLGVVSRNPQRTCQEVDEERFSTTSLYPVLGPGGCKYRITLCLYQLFKHCSHISSQQVPCCKKTNLAPPITTSTVPARVSGELNSHSSSVHRFAIKLLTTPILAIFCLTLNSLVI